MRVTKTDRTCNVPYQAPLGTICAMLAKSIEFKRGYDEYFKDIDPDYRTVDFERGRLFGVYTKLNRCPKSRWAKGVLSKAARERLYSAFLYGYIR
jgi:hypothetical protein